VTKYDYDKKGTYKSPTMTGEKGYYIPYSLKGEFFPSLNLSINSYFVDFKVIIPYNFKKPMLDDNDGTIGMTLKEDEEKMDPNLEKNNIVITEDDFDVIIKEELTLDGLANLEK
jgi:hypothetical protein